MNEPDQLKDLVLQQIPEIFFTQLWARQAALYEQARDHSRETHLWTGVESDTVWPVCRRAAMEHEARLAAIEAKLDYFDSKHAGGYPYGIVRSGTFALTFHHESGPNAVVRKCVSRVQNSGVNAYLDHYVMQEMLVEPLPDLNQAGIIYGCVIHGITIEKRAGKEYPSYFMRLAFPDAEFSTYTKNFDIGELLQQYALIRAKRELPIMEHEDLAVPVLNPKKKKDVIG